ncbi:hypothetical protein L218DRAFT_949037 [Marasmius fiardii PR-910]|nr:hypothetical protein L218DRAFT_949037 [Marasmius fiardii PR-910]
MTWMVMGLYVILDIAFSQYTNSPPVNSLVKKNTTEVAIGLLELCGNTFVINSAGGKQIISPCVQDPAVEDNILEQWKLGFGAPGKTKVMMTNKQAGKVEAELWGLSNVYYQTFLAN